MNALGKVAVDSRLFEAIVYIALGLVAYIVVLGGIVCVKDEDYTFTQYLVDIKGVYKLLVVAIIGAIARELVTRMGTKVEPGPGMKR